MKNPWTRAVLMSAVLVLGASAASAETNFPATVQLGGQTLVKNGQGTRYRAVFKVYDMALYLPSRTQDAAQVLAMPGAKRASLKRAAIFRAKKMQYWASKSVSWAAKELSL